MIKLRWILLVMVGLFIAGHLEARPPVRQTGPAAKPVVIDNDTRIDVNNISMVVTNQGSYAFDVEGGGAGLEFPKGTGNTAVFAGGIWIGGKVSDEIRVAAAVFDFEFRPGPIISGKPADMTDPRYHVYKINRGDGPENPDWKDWPVADGAPVDQDGKPLVLGDQTLWAVYNDADQAWHTSFSTQPLGVEVQQTTFAFNRTGALGNTIFLKFLITNKGGNKIDSTYVSVWSDPDLGQFDDDLVGCDVDKSLGFVYNSTNADAVYGAAPPSVGFDFFKGPIGDDGVELPMTSFNKYINGTDPQTGQEVYNYMKGIDRDGDVKDHIDPTTGQVTAFMLSGDPVTGLGWLDENPADRRLMLSAGPFTFDPGESQEVVAAIVIGQGKDRLTSITAMRFFDSFAQAAFDANFGLPTPPTKPNVTVTPLGDPETGNGKVVLTWDDVSEKSMTGEYVFEGYNVYQGASIAGPWKRVATFDAKNEVTIIFDEEFDTDAGVVVSKPVQFGGDTGLKHFFEVKEDFITGGPLVNGKTYFFAVTAYAYNPEGAPKVLETPPAPLWDGRTRLVRFAIDPGQVEPILGIIPRSPTAGSDVGVAGVFQPGKIDSAATHKAGVSDGEVTVRVIDPSKVTGNAYQVRFREIEQPSPDDPSVMIPVTVWDLVNTTKGTIAMGGLPENSSAEDGEANPIIDGLLVKAIGPPAGIQRYQWLRDGQVNSADRWLAGQDVGGHVGLGGGLVEGDHFFGSSITKGKDFINVEIRFVNFAERETKGQRAYRYLRGGTPNYAYQGYDYVPFTAWDTEATPPRQINVAFVEQNGSPAQDGTWLPTDSAGDREYLFILKSTYTPDPQEFYTSRRPTANAAEFDVLYALWPLVRGGHTVPDEIVDGQVLRIIANNVNTTEDVFEFTTVAPVRDDPRVAQDKAHLKRIRMVPNPYYGQSTYELNQFVRVTRFTNLPKQCTIRIFNLAGEQVRKIDHTNGTSIETWDLMTDHDLPLGSGIYVVHVDAPGIGKHFFKVAIFTEQERLETF